MKWVETIRQFRYAREFRIAPSIWPPDMIGLMDKLLQELKDQKREEAKPVEPDLEPTPPIDPAMEKKRRRLFANIGLGLWRIKQQLIDKNTQKPIEELQRPYRHLISVWDILEENGVVIQDHTNTVFHPGFSLNVLAFVPTKGLKRETVIETIKPSIYLDKETIHLGQVIVGIPEKSDES